MHAIEGELWIKKLTVNGEEELNESGKKVISEFIQKQSIYLYNG